MSYGGSSGNSVITTDKAIEWAEKGYEYEAAVVVNIANGSTRYIGFEIPVGSTDRFVALQTRYFKSDDPQVDLEILWDTASITGGTVKVPFNNHRAVNRPSYVVFTDNASVDETGSQVREEDFIGGDTGGFFGGGSSGQIPPSTGFRIYRAGEHFVVKLTNNSGGTNKVKLGYKWAEPPISEMVV